MISGTGISVLLITDESTTVNAYQFFSAHVTLVVLEELCYKEKTTVLIVY
jgi:hypothetical protein